jgi:hypothetical protein
MNRVLKRPMFRMGGSTGTGITSGLDQPRKQYQQGSMPNFQFGGVPGFLTNFGLNLLATPPQGNIFATAATAARDPFNQLQKFQTARALTQAERDFEQKKLAEGREFTEKMTQKEIKAADERLTRQLESKERIANMDKSMSLEDLTQLYLPDYQGEGNAEIKASNRAKYTKLVLPELRTTVGDTQIGGIIEADLSDPKAAKRFANQNKNKVGKVFYDINTGQSVILTRDPETNALGFIPYQIGMDMRSASDEIDIQPSANQPKEINYLSESQKAKLKEIQEGSDKDFGLGFYD